jgi:hypothetical protein
MEALAVGAIRTHVKDCSKDVSDRVLVTEYLNKVVIKRGTLVVILKGDDDSSASPITVSWSPQPTRCKRGLIIPPSPSAASNRPIRSESRARLIEGIATGRAWLNELTSGKITEISQIAKRERRSERSVRMTISLAFLSPTIVKAAIDGTLPYGVGVTQLIEAPADWNDQLQLLQ